MSAGFTWREVINDLCEGAHGAAPKGWPKPLGDFWEAGGAAALSRQNQFQAPEGEDGYSVFYVENQDVCRWAYRTGDAAEDPDVQAPNFGWVPVGCRLSAFLSAAAVTEIALGAPSGRAAEGPTRYADEVIGLDCVQLPELGWPRGVTTSYYKGPDVLAFAQNEDGYSFAFVGARRVEALREIDERIEASPYWEFA